MVAGNIAGFQVWAPVQAKHASKHHNGCTKKNVVAAAWTPAVVLKLVNDVNKDTEEDTKLEVEYIDADGKKHVTIYHSSELHVRSSSDDLTPPEDVTSLFNLSEPEVLHGLARRYQLGQIYTSSSEILIAVNPFQPMPHLFDPETLQRYTQASSLSSLPPHVFKSAAQAYQNLKSSDKPQAILITGESGAGKTETAKCILCLLSTISSSHKADPQSQELSIEMKLLDTNPLLEAFGNAKTVRNNNSSRFGKYIELQFRSNSDGSLTLCGALVRTYLLERSRVVHTNEGERSFHIFYQMIAGASEEERKRWSLKSLPSLINSSVDGIDDVSEFSATRNAMANIGVSADECEQVFQALSAILHLRSVAFVEDKDGEGSTVSPNDRSRHHLETAAGLLGLDATALSRSVTRKTIQTSDGAIEILLRPIEAKQSCDSFSKSLYSEIFDWLISRVNHSLLPSSLSEAGAMESAPRTIGILDIYGFESLAHNDLEQLCINLTNEKLQQHFNRHVLSWEQREYESEGIEWTKISWIDNSDIIDLIEGKKVQSVMSLLDEAAKLPRTTPQELTHKLASSPFIKASGRFSQPSSGQSFDSRCAFDLEHYAGLVTYQTINMMTKNREASGAGSTERDLLSTSSLPLLDIIFSRVSNAVASSASSLSSGSSVVSRFRLQLSKMMELISGCSPHFIRCIKPNPEAKPMSFDAPYALKQLRCGGIMEAVRIARAGFPFKQLHKSFLARFWPLTPLSIRLDTKALLKVAAEQFLATAFDALDGDCSGKWAVGTFKVFMKADLADYLEKRLSRVLYDSSARIQASWRGYRQRIRFISLRAATVTVQASWRAKAARRLCHELREERRRTAATLLQSIWRGRVARINFLSLVRSATILQAHWRGRMGRILLLNLIVNHRAAIVIQRRWRSSRGVDLDSNRSIRGERVRLLVLLALESDRAAKTFQNAWRCLMARRELIHLRTLAQRQLFNQRIASFNQPSESFNTKSQGGGVLNSSASVGSRILRSSGGGARKGCDQNVSSSHSFGVALVAVKTAQCFHHGGRVIDRDEDEADDVGGSLRWIMKAGQWVKRSSNRDSVV